MKNIIFEAIAKIDDKTAIAIPYDFNAVFKIDLDTEKCRYIGMVPNEKIDGKRLYTQACFTGEKIYFIPAAAKEIAMYDLINEKISKIKFNMTFENASMYKKDKNFNGAVMYGKYIFMVPCTYPAVVRINTEDNSISYFANDLENKEYLFRKSIEVDNAFFYVPSAINNLVFEFNMEDCIGKLHQVGKNNNGCWSMCKKNNFFWLAPQSEGPIIKWDSLSGEYTELNVYPSEFVGNGFCFTKIYSSGEELYLIPAMANMAIKISKDEKIVPAEITKLNNNDVVLFMFELGDYLYLMAQKNECISYIKISVQDNKVSTYNFTYDENELKADLRKEMHKNKIIKENFNWGLKDYIEDVCETRIK